MFIIDRTVCSRLYRIQCHSRDNKQYLSKTNTVASFSLLNDLEMALEIIRTMHNKHLNVRPT